MNDKPTMTYEEFTQQMKRECEPGRVIGPLPELLERPPRTYDKCFMFQITVFAGDETRKQHRQRIHDALVKGGLCQKIGDGFAIMLDDADELDDPQPHIREAKE